MRPTSISLSSSEVVENEPIGALVGSLSTTDPDQDDKFEYSLVDGAGGTDNNSFSIEGSSVRAGASFDYEEQRSYSIRVRTADQGGLFHDETFTIHVEDSNEAPTDVSISASGVGENEPVGTLVGKLSATDADKNEKFRYSLVAGAGDGLTELQRCS